MVKKVEGGFQCSICNTIHSRDVYALSCEQSHDIIYVPFKSEDLFRLVQFLYTKDDSLLSESLMKTLLKYRSRNYFGKEKENDLQISD